MFDEYHAEINVIVKALLDSFMVLKGVLGIIGFCSWICELRNENGRIKGEESVVLKAYKRQNGCN